LGELPFKVDINSKYTHFYAAWHVHMLLCECLSKYNSDCSLFMSTSFPSLGEQVGPELYFTL